MQEAEKIKKEIIIGVVVLAFIEVIVGSFVTFDFIRYILGGILGSGAGILFVSDLYKALDVSLDMDEENSIKYARKMTTRRMFAVAVTFAIGIFLSTYVSVLMVFLGVMNVKFAVFLQPLTDRLLSKKFIDKGR